MKTEPLEMTSPSRTAILKAIFCCLQSSIVNKPIAPDWTATRVKYLFKAEALIELLEVHDCGSTGGFDKEIGRPNGDGNLSFYDRFAWLVKKYDLQKEVEKGQSYTIAHLRRYFHN